MSQQTGYIQVMNNTGFQIVEGYITHATHDYGVQTISLTGLPNGEATPVQQVITGPSSKDYWYVCWTNKYPKDDGYGWLAWSGISAIHDHWASDNPGTITLEGVYSQTSLAVVFMIDGIKTVKYDIPTPY